MPGLLLLAVWLVLVILIGITGCAVCNSALSDVVFECTALASVQQRYADLSIPQYAHFLLSLVTYLQGVSHFVRGCIDFIKIRRVAMFGTTDHTLWLPEACKMLLLHVAHENDSITHYVLQVALCHTWSKTFQAGLRWVSQQVHYNRAV